jgi:hypothetical protein
LKREGFEKRRREGFETRPCFFQRDFVHKIFVSQSSNLN